MTVDTKKRPAEPEVANEEPSQASAEYKVGYGKPPRETQFKKGQSGNPRGTRRQLSAAETAAKVLARLMTITENGKKRRAAMQEIILMAQAARAAKGDPKSAKMLFELNDKAPPPPEAYSMADLEADFQEAIVGFTLEQLETINDFEKRMRVAQNMRRSKKPK